MSGAQNQTMEKVTNEKLAELIARLESAFSADAAEFAPDNTSALRELRALRARHREAMELLERAYDWACTDVCWRGDYNAFLAKEQSDD